jgi:hypothetical protein
MADIYHRRKRKPIVPVEMPPEFYIRERTHFSACAVNEYWYVSIHYPKHQITRQLNKRFYTHEQATEVVKQLLLEHGTPPKQKYRKVSNTYSQNAEDIKNRDRQRVRMLSQHTDPSLPEKLPTDADTEEEAYVGIESLLTRV